MSDSEVNLDEIFCRECETFIEGAYKEMQEREKQNNSQLESSDTYVGEQLIHEYWTEFALTLPTVGIHQCRHLDP